MRLLERLGVAPDGSEIHKLPVILGRLCGPNHLHGLDPLAQHFPAPLKRRAVILHLLGVPAPADATALARIIGSRSTTRQIPLPTLSVLVTAAAAVSATNRSCRCHR